MKQNMKQKMRWSMGILFSLVLMLSLVPEMSLAAADDLKNEVQERGGKENTSREMAARPGN